MKLLLGFYPFLCFFCLFVVCFVFSFLIHKETRGYKFSCYKMSFQLELSITITFHRLGKISLAFTFHEWDCGDPVLCFVILCIQISQMLSQGTAAWVDIWRREWELRICMYPCSLNSFLKKLSKFEITSNFLVSLDKKHGASQASLIQGFGFPFQILSLSQQSVSSWGGDGNFVCQSHPENSWR